MGQTRAHSQRGPHGCESTKHSATVHVPISTLETMSIVLWQVFANLFTLTVSKNAISEGEQYEESDRHLLWTAPRFITELKQQYETNKQTISQTNPNLKSITTLHL